MLVFFFAFSLLVRLQLEWLGVTRSTVQISASITPKQDNTIIQHWRCELISPKFHLSWVDFPVSSLWKPEASPSIPRRSAWAGRSRRTSSSRWMWNAQASPPSGGRSCPGWWAAPSGRGSRGRWPTSRPTTAAGFGPAPTAPWDWPTCGCRTPVTTWLPWRTGQEAAGTLVWSSKWTVRRWDWIQSHLSQLFSAFLSFSHESPDCLLHRGAVRGPPVSVRLCCGPGRSSGTAHAVHVAAGQALQEGRGLAEEETEARYSRAAASAPAPLICSWVVLPQFSRKRRHRAAASLKQHQRWADVYSVWKEHQVPVFPLPDWWLRAVQTGFLFPVDAWLEVFQMGVHCWESFSATCEQLNSFPCFRFINLLSVNSLDQSHFFINQFLKPDTFNKTLIGSCHTLTAWRFFSSNLTSEFLD